jgi:cyclopropane fatty-acyl-phospholipid synthase-like methyltransferase
VLDIGCGKGYLLTRMAERCGITGTGIEINPWFCGDARQRSQRAGVDQHITIIESDARDMVLPERQFDAAVCIGATFALGGLLPCLATMRRVVKPGGMIAIGDVFRQQNQLPADMPPHWQALPTMPELIDTIRGNHEAIECIAANLDDWDAYESRKWRTAQAWKARHHDDPEYADFCQMVDDMRREYLVEERPHIGWAIIATINE